MAAQTTKSSTRVRSAKPSRVRSAKPTEAQVTSSPKVTKFTEFCSRCHGAIPKGSVWGSDLKIGGVRVWHQTRDLCDPEGVAQFDALPEGERQAWYKEAKELAWAALPKAERERRSALYESKVEARAAAKQQKAKPKASGRRSAKPTAAPSRSPKATVKPSNDVKASLRDGIALMAAAVQQMAEAVNSL